jgi:regulatory protein
VKADPADTQALQESALRLLTARSRSAAELREALLQRGFLPELVDELVRRWLEVDLLNDRRYAADFTAYSRRQLRSDRVIRLELRKRGVCEADIESALEGEADEFGRAMELAARRAKSLAGLPADTAYRRLAGALARRGFSPEVVAQVVKASLAQSG